MIRVEHDERPLSFRATADLGDELGIGRRPAAKVGDPRVRRVVVPRRLDVDGDDLTDTEQVADRSEVERAPTAIRSGLDDQLGSRLDHDLLVDPEVERVLERLGAEPFCLRPGVRDVEDVVGPRDGCTVEPLADAERDAANAAWQRCPHGRGF